MREMVKWSFYFMSPIAHRWNCKERCKLMWKPCKINMLIAYTVFIAVVNENT